MRALVSGLALVVCTGCSAIFGLEDPQRQVDAAMSRDDTAVSDVAVDASTMWTGAQMALTTSLDADDPTLTDDMLEMYFDGGGDIYVTTRPDLTSAWTTPTVVTQLSSPSGETTPEVSGDGLTMVISSNRAGGAGVYDLWASDRATRTAAWNMPVVFTVLNSANEDASGSWTLTASPEIVLSSNRGSSSGTAAQFDIYLSTFTGSGGFGMPAKLTDVSSAMADQSPFITHDGQTLYLDSNRSGTNQLYVSTRAPGGGWNEPQQIVELSTLAGETDPWVSPDGRHMFFSRAVSGKKKIFEASR